MKYTVILKKYIITLAVAFWVLFSFTEDVYAGNFVSEGGYVMRDFHSSDTWSRSFNTKNGIFKFRFREVDKATPDKKYHLMVWLNRGKIYDVYLPELRNNARYELQFFRDRVTDNICMAIQTDNRAILLKYDNVLKTMVACADNKKDQNLKGRGNANLPKFTAYDANEEGDFQLYYYSNSDEYGKRYMLNINSNAVEIKDITIDPPPPPPPPVYYETFVYTVSDEDANDYDGSTWDNSYDDGGVSSYQEEYVDLYTSGDSGYDMYTSSDDYGLYVSD